VFLTGTAGAWGVSWRSGRLGLGFLCHGLFGRCYWSWKCFGCFPFGLVFAEFGSAFVEDSMSLGAGAIHRLLNLYSPSLGGFHGIEDVMLVIVETDDEMGFDFAATAETPGGAMNFFHEDIFEEIARGQLVDESGMKGFVALFFAGADKVSGEESEGDGVFCGDGFSGWCNRSVRKLCVSGIGCDLSCG
jgi:hypothetical protein